MCTTFMTLARRPHHPHCCTNPQAVMYAIHVVSSIAPVRSFLCFRLFRTLSSLPPWSCKFCGPFGCTVSFVMWFFSVKTLFFFFLLLPLAVCHLHVLVFVHFNQARLGEFHVHLHHRLAKPPQVLCSRKGGVLPIFCIVIVSFVVLFIPS